MIFVNIDKLQGFSTVFLLLLFNMYVNISL